MTEFRHKTEGKNERIIIEPRKGSSAGLVSERAWTLLILNATTPESVKINGKKVSS